MRASKKIITRQLASILFGALFVAAPAMAASDLEAQEAFAKARSKSLLNESEHAAHHKPADTSQDFYGVFYGYLPCDDCAGVKTTLSLQQKHNYLLVIQPARESSREYFERGKYQWNDNDRIVVLTPKKEGISPRRYYIENEGTLIQLNEHGIRMDRHVLQRSDVVKSREVHIH